MTLRSASSVWYALWRGGELAPARLNRARTSVRVSWRLYDRQRSLVSQHDPQTMDLLIIDDRNPRPVVERDAVELHHHHPPANTAGVLDGDIVARGTIPERQGESRPSRGDARVHHQSRALDPDPENPFDPGAIQPPRRPGIPGPPAPADVRRLGVDVAHGDIRFDAVLLDAMRSHRAHDRIQHREQLGGLVAVTERDERNYRPDGRLRVLPPIFAHSSHVPLDVAGSQRCVVEGR